MGSLAAVVLGVGVPLPPGYRSGPFHLTMILATVAAILIVRFVLRFELTVPAVLLAAAGGVSWVLAQEDWGIVPSIIVALVVVGTLLIALPRLRSR